MSNEKNKKEAVEEKVRTVVHKDYQELGRITVEDLNEYFDLDLMATARRRRK